VRQHYRLMNKRIASPLEDVRFPYHISAYGGLSTHILGTFAVRVIQILRSRDDRHTLLGLCLLLATLRNEGPRALIVGRGCAKVMYVCGWGGRRRGGRGNENWQEQRHCSHD